MNQKKWYADYTVKYIDGSESEDRATVFARTVSGALRGAQEAAAVLRKEDPSIQSVCIWSVCIGAEEVI